MAGVICEPSNQGTDDLIRSLGDKIEFAMGLIIKGSVV